jgi:flagellin
MAIGSINDNSKSNAALRGIASASKEKESLIEQLAAGSRLTRARFDPAGLAVVAALEASVKTSRQGARNSLDGESFASFADSAIASVTAIEQRQAELATQASSGQFSDAQLENLDAEFQALNQEKSRIISSTQFNGVNVFSSSGEESISIQVGNDGGENSQISLIRVNPQQTQGLDLRSNENARAALDSVNESIQSLAAERGRLGADVNRLGFAQNQATESAIQAEAAASRIRDLDFAEATARFLRTNILEQGGTALLAQANLSSQNVLKLLS